MYDSIHFEICHYWVIMFFPMHVFASHNITVQLWTYKHTDRQNPRDKCHELISTAWQFLFYFNFSRFRTTQVCIWDKLKELKTEQQWNHKNVIYLSYICTKPNFTIVDVIISLKLSIKKGSATTAHFQLTSLSSVVARLAKSNSMVIFVPTTLSYLLMSVGHCANSFFAPQCLVLLTTCLSVLLFGQLTTDKLQAVLRALFKWHPTTVSLFFFGLMLLITGQFAVNARLVYCKITCEIHWAEKISLFPLKLWVYAE